MSKRQDLLSQVFPLQAKRKCKSGKLDIILSLLDHRFKLRFSKLEVSKYNIPSGGTDKIQ